MKDYSTKDKTTQFSIRIDERLYNRIDNHIRILQQTKSAANKRIPWVISAIEKKLAREKPLGYTNIPKEKTMGIRMDAELHQQLADRVNLIRKFRSSYNKKLWVLEAIQEKIEQEEPKARQILDNLNKDNAH
ncbi:MAG: hypothetical protein ACE5GN_05020 [Waddliaceae bacterium]